jgi:hypothetical protein
MLAATNRFDRIAFTLKPAARPVAATPACPVQVGGATIELRLASLNDLLDACCAAPLHERELNEAVEAHIVAAAKDLPADATPRLVVTLQRATGIDHAQALIETAVRVHFARRAARGWRQLQQLVGRASLSLFIAVSIVAVSALVREKLAHGVGQNPVVSIFCECLLIGAWVAMWKPMEILLHEWWSMRNEKQIMSRLSTTSVTASEPTAAELVEDESEVVVVARPARRVSARRRIVRRRVGR